MSRWSWLVACLLATAWAGRSAAHGTWTLSGHAGICVDQSDASLAWWGALHRWMSPALGVGVEAGHRHWEPEPDDGFRYADFDPRFVPSLGGLSGRGFNLHNVSGSVSLRGLNRTESSAALAAFSIGAYLQEHAYRRDARGFIDRASTTTLVRPGFGISFGGGSTRGIAPGAALRFDWVDTRPERSMFLAWAVGLHANR
jgi:hypothetical protein